MEKDFLYVYELREKGSFLACKNFRETCNFLVYQGNQLSQGPKLLF